MKVCVRNGNTIYYFFPHNSLPTSKVYLNKERLKTCSKFFLDIYSKLRNSRSFRLNSIIIFLFKINLFWWKADNKKNCFPHYSINFEQRKWLRLLSDSSFNCFILKIWYNYNNLQ